MRSESYAPPAARSERPLKVLHVIVGLKVGGAELMLRRLVTNPPAGVNHLVVSLTELGPIGAELRQLGVRVEALHMRGVMDTLRGLAQLTRLIRQEQPDVVQTWMYHADFMGGVAARLAGHPRVFWNVRATDIRGDSRSVIWLQRACALLSPWVPTAVLFAANASRQEHVRLGYRPRRSLVLPNGFNVEPFRLAREARAAHRRAFGISDDDLIVGIVSRFHPHKDIQTFVRAAGLLAKTVPSARFLMVGRSLDRENPELAQWLVDAGISDRVILAGEQRDVPACYAAMDIFGLSSRTEAFPNVVGEAMAAGVPAAVTNVGDAALLLGDCGLAVPRLDPEALAGALERLCALTPEAREELGQRAQRRIESEFSLEAMRTRYLAIYRAEAGEVVG